MRFVPKTLLAALAALIVTASPLRAAAQADCHAPAAPDHRYYVDAVRGSDGADGRTPATAWKSLGRLFRRGLDAPFLSGAEIVLADGDYGRFVVGQYRDAAPPRADGSVPYLSFVAARGAHPVISSLTIAGSERIRFSGIRFQSQPGMTEFRPLVQILANAERPVRDIRLSDNDVTSGGDYRNWTQDQWMARAARGGIAVAGNPSSSARCIVITRNHVHGVGNGVVLAADDTQLLANRIEDFALDAIEIAGNRLDIVGNRVSDNQTLPVANHNDMIQGLLGPQDKSGGVSTWEDVHIIGNLLVRQTRPDLKLTGQVQGIDGFAGIWERLVVANNVVIVGGPRRLSGTVFYSLSERGDAPFAVFRPCTGDAPWRRQRADPGVNAGNVRTVPVERLGWLTACGAHALTFGEVRHGAIVHNTLLTDNPAMQIAGVWIKPRSPDRNGTCDTIIANNLGNWSDLSAIASTLVPLPPASAAQREAACAPGHARNYAAGNLELHAGTPGGVDARKVFRDFAGFYDPAGRTFGWDLHLRPGSPAIGAGDAAMARAALGGLAGKDIEGRTRTRADAGAYAF